MENNDYKSKLINLLLNSILGSVIFISLMGVLAQEPRYEGCLPINDPMQNMIWYLHQYWPLIFFVSSVAIVCSYFLKKSKKSLSR